MSRLSGKPRAAFPFLFGGTFIEAWTLPTGTLRLSRRFPFLFGGTFIEAETFAHGSMLSLAFPFLFGGTFIEANTVGVTRLKFLAISLPFRRDFH